MEENENVVLDEDQWKLEAQAVINDLKQHVTEIRVSEILQSTNQLIYLNLTTLEGLRFCVELSGAGFVIVGDEYDNTSKTSNEYFETPYGLLDLISLGYRTSFGNSLLNKLKELETEK